MSFNAEQWKREGRANALRECGVPALVADEFLHHRKELKKPLTTYGEWLLYRKLWKLMQEGHKPVTLLQEAILNGWLSVWAPKIRMAQRNPQPKPEVEQTPCRQCNSLVDTLLDGGLCYDCKYPRPLLGEKW